MNPVDFIHEETNLAKHITSALGYAQPMVLPFRNIVVVSKGSNDKYVYENVDTIRKPDDGKLEKGLSNLGDNFFQCPLSFDIDGEQWRLPVDPLISVGQGRQKRLGEGVLEPGRLRHHDSGRADSGRQCLPD